MAPNILHKYSQTLGERTKIDDIMTIALLLQRIFGHQVLDPKWNWKNFYHYQLLSLLLTIYVFIGTLQIVRNTKEAELLAEASYTLVLIVLCPIKVVLFIQNRKSFRKLYLTAKTIFFQFIKERSESRFENVLRNANKAVYALLAMVVVPIMLYELKAFWYYFGGERILLSRSTSTLLPLTSPYYEVSWLLHSVFLVEMSCIIIVTDMWYVFLMTFLCLATDCLKKLLVVQERGIDEDESAYEERLNKSLRIFYEAHLPQVEYVAKLSSMYKWLGFIPLVNAACCICIVLLVVSKEVNWMFASHMLPLFSEVLAFSWFGELLKTKLMHHCLNGEGKHREETCLPRWHVQSTNPHWASVVDYGPYPLSVRGGLSPNSGMYEIKMALMNFDWLNLSQKDKLNYLIMITYIKKDFGIKTAVGNDLCLITMTTVLKGSYQAFTVLQTLD